MAGLESVVVLEVIREHREELQKYILTDIKEVSCTGRGKEPPENDEKDLNRAGAYGNLVALECRNGTQVAGKVLHSIFFTSGTEPNGVRKLLTKFFEEIKLLSKMNHPNIVQFLGMYYREGSLLPVLVMEKMEWDLSEFLKAHKKGSLPDDRVLGILLDVSKGLVYLHEEMKIAHRDLSSNNILLTSNQSAKIADLGSARVLDKPGGWDPETKLTEQPGTAIFMPPEALEDPPKYTVSVDVFSFGCVIIHLCTHKWPNPIGQTAQGKIISELDRRHKYISEINQSYLLPLIKQCLEDVDTNRPTSSTIMSILQAKVDENASELPLCYTLQQIG